MTMPLSPGDGAVVVLMTAASASEAERVVTALVEEGLAACGNITGPVTSIYRWKGELQRDQEVVVLLKTLRHRLPAMADRIKALHSYECPELLALPVEQGSTAYLEWVASNTGS